MYADRNSYGEPLISQQQLQQQLQQQQQQLQQQQYSQQLSQQQRRDDPPSSFHSSSMGLPDPHLGYGDAPQKNPSEAPLSGNHRYYASTTDDVSNEPTTTVAASAGFSSSSRSRPIGKDDEFSTMAVKLRDDTYNNRYGGDINRKPLDGEDTEAAAKAKGDDERVSNELDKMKAELEKQRLIMQERENKWIEEKKVEREKAAVAARQKEEEERDRKEQIVRSEELQAFEDRRREVEREDRKRESEREDKRRDLDREDKRREQDREDTIRENEREDKKREVEREAKAAKIREEELTIREEKLASERKKAEEEKNIDDKDIIGSYKRDGAAVPKHQRIDTVDIDNYDKKFTDSTAVADYAPNKEHEEHSLAPPTASFTPKNMPVKSTMGFRESTVERDSLDIDPDTNSSLEIKGKTLHSHGTGASQIIGEENDFLGRLPDVSTIEHNEEDSFDSHMLGLAGRDDDDDVDVDYDNRISGPNQTEGKKLFGAVLDTSTDSDEVSGSGSGSGSGYRQKNRMEDPKKLLAEVKNVLEEDGGSLSKIVSNVEKVKSKEDLEREENERIEIEKIMIATRLAKEEQEKKEADMKAIQDARASVIARRKQKSERDAVAASLSALPSKTVEKPTSVSASTPHTFAPSSYQAQSSSDESVSPNESDRMKDKSKSVIGVSTFF